MKQKSKVTVSNNIIVLAALIIMCVILAIVSPYFATKKNLINIVLQASINATLACGMTL